MKKKKPKDPLKTEAPLAQKGAYEGEGCLYEGGQERHSLKEEVLRHHHHQRRVREAKWYNGGKSKHVPRDLTERQVVPLLVFFKWVILGVIGLGLVFVLNRFLADFNKNAEDEIAEYRAQLEEVRRIRVERPVLDSENEAQISDSVSRWKAARERVVVAEDLMRWERGEEALRHLHEALVLTPDCQDARVLTAQIAMKGKDYERAVNMLIHALNVDPGKHDLVVMLAQALEKLGDDRSAFVAAEWALAGQATDLDVLGIASRTSVRLEAWDSALKYFKKILILDERNLVALRGASAIYFRDKNYASSLPLLKRLMNQEPEEWRHFFRAAVCQAQLKRPQGTVATLELAASYFGDDHIFGWVGASDFDPVREDDLFLGFKKRVSQIARRKVRKKIEEEKPVYAPAGPSLPTGEALNLKK